MSENSSFQNLMECLKASEPDAAEQVFQRYAQRLIAVARAHLDNQAHRKVDPEDVLQSVFRCFFTRQAEGEWILNSWDNLWSMLIVITVRKCGQWNQHFRWGRRNAALEVPAGSGGTDSGQQWEVAALEPTPEEAILLAETVAEIMKTLKDRERPVLMLSLQGYSIPEISEQIGRTGARSAGCGSASANGWKPCGPRMSRRREPSPPPSAPQLHFVEHGQRSGNGLARVAAGRQLCAGPGG